MNEKNDLLKIMREGGELSAAQQLLLAVRLSIPAIMAQLSSIVMQYIDASMVGRLGAIDSAGIGMIAPSTWLVSGVCQAVGTGFMVQVAHRVGASDDRGARDIVKHGLIFSVAFGALIAAFCAYVSGIIPVWLGAEPEVCASATKYFLVYSLFLPAMMIFMAASGMVQCSGNMKLPSIAGVTMCVLDVIFNYFLIFKTREITIFGYGIIVPGAGLGVTGAALGTALAGFVCAVWVTVYLLKKADKLRFIKGEKTEFSPDIISKALRIAVPMALESVVLGGAQVVSVKIVAPLGTIALAANSFAVTAESLCYMPVYGIGAATTALIGQSAGAGRPALTRKLAWLSTGLGVGVISFLSVLMYILAPFMMHILTPDTEIQLLGTSVLRIVAFAEPFYAMEIVANGAFRGVGDTLAPCLLNLFSMWAVRLPLAALLASRLGLRGVWIAMSIELAVRGSLFIIKLCRRKWDIATVTDHSK